MVSLRSMTGFGQGEAAGPLGVVRVEMKSVNHKSFDARVRLPRSLSMLEGEVIAMVRSTLPRGRVEVAIELDRTAPITRQVVFDEQAYAGLEKQLAALANAHPEIEHRVRTGELLAASQLFVLNDAKEGPQEWSEACLAAVAKAVVDLNDARSQEGASLAKVLSARTGAVLALTEQIHVRMEQAPQRLAESLRERLEGLELGAVDPGRLAQEVAILAEKADVTEEVDRLRLHCEHFNGLCRAAEEQEKAVGRKLDFLCQELGREANTVGSKCSDAETAHLVVDLKAEIERLREQVQNVE